MFWKLSTVFLKVQFLSLAWLFTWLLLSNLQLITMEDLDHVRGFLHHHRSRNCQMWCSSFYFHDLIIPSNQIIVSTHPLLVISDLCDTFLSLRMFFHSFYNSICQNTGFFPLFLTLNVLTFLRSVHHSYLDTHTVLRLLFYFIFYQV